MYNTRYFVSFNKNVVLPNPLNTIHNYIIDNLHLPILNVYYRYFYNTNTLLLLFQYPLFTNDDLKLFYNLFSLLENAFDTKFHNFTIFTDSVYDRSKSNKHILIKGSELYSFNINSIHMNCLVDSFLQPKLEIAIKIYNDIYKNISSLLTFVDLYGFGEDVLNFFNYCNIKNTRCFLHCNRTKLTATGQKLLDFNDFINDAKHNSKLKILITTPGRSGFKNHELNNILDCNFNLIIYFSCKNVQVELKDYNLILINKYPEMFESETFIETISYFKKNLYTKISLGNDCCIANHLKQEFYPFDWCKSDKLNSIINILTNRFINFNDKSIVGDTNIHSYINKFDNIQKEQEINIKIKIQDIIFPHDIRKNNQETDYLILQEKLNKRLNKLLKINVSNRIFIRYETRKDNFLLIEKLLPFCYKIIIIFPEKLENYIFPNNHIIWIKDTYSHLHNSWKKEGLIDFFTYLNLLL